MFWPLYSQERTMVPTIEKVRWALGPVLIGVENLSFTRVRTPNHPTHRKSLYKLCYPNHIINGKKVKQSHYRRGVAQRVPGS
jgi:hypothetical protein